MESLLRSLHALDSGSDVVSLELRSKERSVGLAADVPKSVQTVFLQWLQVAYPGMTVGVIPSEPGHSTKRQ